MTIGVKHKKSVKIDDVVPKIRSRTDRHTDTLIAILFHPYWGRSNDKQSIAMCLLFSG